MKPVVKVLLVDDQRNIVEALAQIGDFQRFPNFAKMEVTVCRTYDMAHRRLINEHFDVLLLDNDLGEEKTGYGLLCELEEGVAAGKIEMPDYVFPVSANLPARRMMLQCLSKMKTREWIEDFG